MKICLWKKKIKQNKTAKKTFFSAGVEPQTLGVKRVIYCTTTTKVKSIVIFNFFAHEILLVDAV